MPTQSNYTFLTGSLESPLTSNYVVTGQWYDYAAEGCFGLSLKTSFNDSAYFEAGRALRRVQDGHYIIVNEGSPYKVWIPARQPVECLSIFFARGFADQVHRSLKCRTGEPQPAGQASSIDFVEKVYESDDLVAQLQRFRENFPLMRYERDWMVEQFYLMMIKMLKVRHRTLSDISRFPLSRAATRDDLYRRFHAARDFANAKLDCQITLDDMADVACLSPSYFLRTFKKAFRQTPHQYLTDLRIERAKKLLVESDDSVTEICRMVGFQSLGSFSWLFKRKVGSSPESYRRENRTDRMMVSIPGLMI